jgi:hypothetical protein
MPPSRQLATDPLPQAMATDVAAIPERTFQITHPTGRFRSKVGGRSHGASPIEAFDQTRLFWPERIKMNRLLVLTSALALIASPGVALAQTSTPSPSSAASEMTGKVNETLIKKKLEGEGYSNIELQRAENSTSASGTSTPETSAKPEYTGTATKDGKTVNIEVNSEGKVTEK